MEVPNVCGSEPGYPDQLQTLGGLAQRNGAGHLRVTPLGGDPAVGMDFGIRSPDAQCGDVVEIDAVRLYP